MAQENRQQRAIGASKICIRHVSAQKQNLSVRLFNHQVKTSQNIDRFYTDVAKASKITWHQMGD
jgi:hypothetical protein